ncbi:MAG TPA: hypothetical protein VHK27_04950 [Gammaproteobacteria bacterium]|nr:hypothetical protein [Gammaproteobacteria bacterium]
MITFAGSEARSATVLKADLTSSTDRSVQFGTVLCKWRDEFVVWHVERKPDDGEWHAMWGHYFSAHHYDEALSDYDTRRKYPG